MLNPRCLLIPTAVMAIAAGACGTTKASPSAQVSPSPMVTASDGPSDSPSPSDSPTAGTPAPAASPAPAAGGGGGAKQHGANAAFRTCMAQHGVTDPATARANKTSPTVQAALQACRSLRVGGRKAAGATAVAGATAG